jgi:hypothetical protein
MKAKLRFCRTVLLSGVFTLWMAIPFAGRGADTLGPGPQTIKMPGLNRRVLFTEYPTVFVVQMSMPSYLDEEKHWQPISHDQHQQVWLLRADGTSISQCRKPVLIGVGSGDWWSTFTFQKQSTKEVVGIVVSEMGNFYSQEMYESKGNAASARNDGDIFQISPTNISDSPISVQVTNADSSERFTVLYKIDKTADKFTQGWLEESDGDSVIFSDAVLKIWTTNGFKFEFNPGGFWRLKFKIIESGHDRDRAMSGFTGYWFYLRDFATNAAMVTAADKIISNGDLRMGTIQIPGLNELVALTEQPTQYTVQVIVASYRDHEGLIYPKVDELHRQVWLLRPDGTTIPQSQKPEVLGTGSGGYADIHLIFIFRKKSPNEVAGIVVSVNGKLYCRELQNDWNKP